MRNLSMKKFGTPPFAGPGGANEQVGFVGAGEPLALVSFGAGTGVTTGAGADGTLRHPEVEVEVQTLTRPVLTLERFASLLVRTCFLRGVAVAVAVAVEVGAAVVVDVAVGAAVCVSVGAGVCVVVSFGASVGASVAVSVGACVGVSTGAAGVLSAATMVAIGVSVAIGVELAEAVIVAVGVGSSALAGIPRRAAAAAALTRAVERIRRVTSPSVSAPETTALSGAGRVQTRSGRILTLNLKIRSCVAGYAEPVDADALDIRGAVPDDAIALAGTTRLGFESYRSWAPAGWQPPPRALEIRSIRERLRASTTWCAMAVEPSGEQAGHVGITHASERDRPHVRLEGQAHLWMLFVRPAWWGTGLAARLHRLGLEEAAREGYA